MTLRIEVDHRLTLHQAVGAVRGLNRSDFRPFLSRIPLVLSEIQQAGRDGLLPHHAQLDGQEIEGRAKALASRWLLEAPA